MKYILELPSDSLDLCPIIWQHFITEIITWESDESDDNPMPCFNVFMINAHLKKFNAFYDYKKGNVTFKTKPDFLLFKLKWS